MNDAITLFRPVGSAELALIENSDFLQFPPRLPEQPIFYPVTNENYAIKIARDWNAKLNEDRVGYVTQFKVPATFMSRVEKRIVGGSEHEEYWVPADQLAELNANIIGRIEVIYEFRGE